MQTDRRKFLEMTESSVIKVATYIHLCQRTGEVSPDAAQVGFSFVDRVALSVRGKCSVVVGMRRSKGKVFESRWRC